MSHKGNDINNDDTQVQAALVVIISQVVVPVIIKSIVYISDKILTWVVGGEDNSMQDTSIINDVLVATVDGSHSVDS